MPTYLAIKRAEEDGLDLVEVGAAATPPVCKIMDFGKYKYDQARKQKEKQRGAAKQPTLKTIRIKPKIGEADLETKIRRSSEFLLNGDKVKVQLQFKGREISHRDLGRNLLDRFAASISAVQEVTPKMEGRSMFMILAPKP